MPSVIAILASGMIWTGVCCVAIFPILVHRLWVDLMEGELDCAFSLEGIENGVHCG